MTPPLKRKLIVLFFVAAVLLLPLAAQATLVEVPQSEWGGVTRTSPTEISGTLDWASGLSVFSSVTRIPDEQGFYVYQYNYSFNSPDGPQLKFVSHFIIQVSANTTGADFWTGGVNDHTGAGTLLLDTWNGQGGSNPEIPNPPGYIYGIKFEFNNQDPATATFFSYRAPVWGDFYVVDGKTPGAEVYAYNLGFGQVISLPFPPGGLDVNQYIITPDSAGGKIPLPPSALLLGSGLLGLGLIGWRRKRQ